MKCRDCRYMYSNETMNGLYICANSNSENFGQYTGFCCEDDCEDGKSMLEETDMRKDFLERKE